MTAILLFPLIPPLIVLFWFGLFFDTGCVQTVAIIGPIFGFLLGSLCAKLYVDIGFVNLGKWIMYSHVFIYTPLFVHAHAMMHLGRSEDNLWKSVLSFHLVGPGWNSDIQACFRHLYTQNHLTS